MTLSENTQRLVVVGGWGVHVEMLAEVYSFWPGPVELVSLDDQLVSCCDTVAGVADELLLRYPEPSVWMGWSLGAQVVMAAADRGAAAVSAMITLAGFPKFLAGNDWPHGMAADEFEAFRHGLEQESGRYWSRFLRLMIKSAGEERAEHQKLKQWLDKGPQVSPENLAKSLDWLRQEDQRPLWSRIDVRVLHITGACDQIVASWLGTLDMPLLALEVNVPGMAHWPGGVFADDCRAVIETFLQSLPGRQL